MIRGFGSVFPSAGSVKACAFILSKYVGRRTWALPALVPTTASLSFPPSCRRPRLNVESGHQGRSGVIETSGPQRAAHARAYGPAKAWSRTKRGIGGTLPTTIL